MTRERLGPCKCPYRIGDPGKAGYEGGWPVLIKIADKYPHLRPCKLVNWNWIRRDECEFCTHGIRETAK